MQDWIIKLERAKALLDAGALTSEQFEAEKARLMPRASRTYVGHDKHQVEASLEDDAPPAFGWSKIGASIVLVVVAATLVLLVLRDRSPAPSPELPQDVAPNLTATRPITTTAPGVPSARVTAPVEPEFGCVGAYSNVSFSEESGDGSGLFVKIGKSGQITWKYYEGSISRGIVKVNKRSANSISANVRWVDYPNEPPSSVLFKCQAGLLSASGANIGNLSLRRLTVDQAAELDQ